LAELATPPELDPLSIDIDGNDYHVWRAVESYQPRVVVIEYNAKFVSPVEWVMPYEPDYQWDGTDRRGASRAALTQLDKSKGYALVGCNITGVNAFFVRDDQLGDQFAQSPGAAGHYHPLRLDLIPAVATGHSAGRFFKSAGLG
jgi:hypothetical protein